MKICRDCGQAKPFEEFYISKGGRDGRRPECKDCNKATQRDRYRNDPQKYIDRVTRWQRENRERYNAKQRAYRAANRDKEREGHLKRKFGITQADYDRLLGDQSGGCAICGTRPSDDVSLHVDHDHETGAVRGLLCFSCNGGLGQFREDPDLLEMAAEYLLSPGPVKARVDEVVRRLRLVE